MEQYLNIIRRWLWLVLLVTVVASATTYWMTKGQEVVYEATARLIVGPGVDSPSPDLNALRTSGQLMQTYAELATTRPVLQMVTERIGLQTDLNRLRGRIDVKFNKEAQILTINVRDNNPERAVAVANSLSEVLVYLSPSGSNSTAAILREQMLNRAERLEQDVANMEARIIQLETASQVNDDLTRQRLLMDQLSQERSRLADTNRTLALLYDSLQQATTNQVKIIEPAAWAYAIPSQVRLHVLVGALAGLVLAVVIAFTIEYFDDTVKTVGTLAEAANAPVLGTIARHKSLPNVGREGLVIQALPESRAAEDYRKLSTKLLLSNGSEPLHSILLGSTHVREDTGEIATNLAVILAQTGNRVVLVEANLNRPTISQLLGIDSDATGLTDILTNKVTEPKLIPITWAPGLLFLPSGSILQDSFALLSSPRMVKLLKQLESEADIVLLAASSLLSSADSLFLASRAGGVVVVVHNGKARREMVADVVENLRSLNAHIVGTILDHNRPRSFPFFSRPAAPAPAEENRPHQEDALPGQVAPSELARGSVKQLKSAKS